MPKLVDLFKNQLVKRCVVGLLDPVATSFRILRLEAGGDVKKSSILKQLVGCFVQCCTNVICQHLAF
ncbi:hypothetical protein [Nostoc sp.]|uniref:hypothetical protein n=1 Tax=Nostoc sp. TaxID=1180 RepID=UPI002FF52925